MGKIVLVHLVDGDFDKGLIVTVHIYSEIENRCIGITKGKLPQSPEIGDRYEIWKSGYLARVDSIRSAARIGGHTNPDPSIKHIEADTRNLKSSINRWLNSYDMFPIKEELFRKLNDRGEEIRFIFKTEDPKLQRLPWHSWDIFGRKDYAKASVSLFLELEKHPPIPRERVKILAVFGKKETSGGSNTINTDSDWESLQKSLSNDSNGEIIRLDEPTCEELCDQIDKQSPQIFFFAGHSSSEDDSARGAIELNQKESINIDRLEYEIADAVEHGLQLAIFNSCDGLGIAQQLSKLGVPNIIVMREIVPDRVAQKFLQRFLEAFVAGKSVSIAVRKAREKINDLESEFPGVTFLPVSFQNPAEAPLTWQALGGVQSRRAEKSQTGNQNSILWLPSAIVNPSQEQQNHPSHTIIIPSPQEEQELPAPGNNSSELEQRQAPATNIHSSESRQQPPSPVIHSFESQPQQQTRHKISILRCSKGHENPAENNFCIYCRESLKQLPVSGVNSSSPQQQQSQLKALENQSVASVNSFSSQPQQSQLNVLGNQSAPLVKQRSTGGGVYCINPKCSNQENPVTLNFCQSCGSKLLIDTRYRVIQYLGEGGFGITYEVRDRDGTRKVLKVLTYTEPKGVELFQKEANVLQRLKHPGLPKVEPDGYFTFKPNHNSSSLHCLVMEKIEGKNLQQWLESQNYTPIDSEQAIDWLTQLTEILNLVHNQNYFHRDIKPQNIMLRPNGKLVLIDFGAVREVTETIQRTNGEVTRISSSGYTSDEQKKGRAEPRSDFFALGRTFVYLLTAQQPRDLPEDARSGKLIWRNIATKTSQPLADLIDDLMAYFPKDRPNDTQVLLQRLAKIVDRSSPAPSAKASIGRMGIIEALIKAFQWRS